MNKICTSIEQSKQLAEILPLKSADMYYEEVCNLPKAIVGNYILHNQCMEDKDYKKLSNPVLSPAWSLAALFDILPKYIGGSRLRIDMSENDFNLWFEDLSSGTVDEILPDITKENPIDTCYEMILELHRQKLL